MQVIEAVEAAQQGRYLRREVVSVSASSTDTAMVYSDFSAAEVVKRFGIRFRAESLFPAVAPMAPSAWLKEALKIGTELGFASEKSRSERLVTPVLMELSSRNNHSFSIIR